MKTFRIKLLVPHEIVIEAVDLKAADEEARRLQRSRNNPDGTPTTRLVSVTEEVDFDEDIPTAPTAA